MGLLADINAAVDEAFDGDLSDAAVVRNVRLITKDDDNFNEATGEYTQDFQAGTCRGIYLKVTQKDIDEFGAEPGSYKFLVLNADQTGLLRSLQIGDEIQHNSKYGAIYKMMVDPVGATSMYFVHES